MFSLPFGSAQSLSAVLLVPIIVATFAILLIGSLLVPGAKPEAAGKAIACYIFKAVGVILVVLGGMQLLFSAFTMAMPETNTLLTLVFLVVIGIGILVHESRVIARLDDASTIVPKMVFGYSCAVIGALAALSGLLTFLVSLIMTQQVEEWQSPATIVITGAVLAFFSAVYAGKKGKVSAAKKKK